MILRGDIQQIENAVMSIRSLDILYNIVFPKHHLQFLQTFDPGDRVLICIPRALLDSETIEYDEDSRMFRDTFKYISDLRQDRYSDIIVLCSSFRPPVPTRGTDSMFSLGLEDHSGSIELKSFIKRPDFEKFVTPGGNEDTAFIPGDVLLLRNVKRGKFGNVAIIYKTCEITTIEGNHGSKRYEDLVAEFLRIQTTRRKLLCKKTKKIEQIRDRSFFNVLGKVLYCDFDTIPTIGITDFTLSSAEPCTGRLSTSEVLIVKMFGRHAELCSRIHLNKHYLFVNIRIHSFIPGLEAYMHDSLEGDVIPIDSQELLKEILSAERNRIPVDKDANKLQSGSDSVDNGADCSLGICSKSECRISEAHLTCKEQLGVAKLAQIRAPGIFLSNCLVKRVEFLESGEGMISRITVEEHRTYTLDVKQKLTVKLLNEKNRLENKKYKCLVLRTASGQLFMVDLFFNDAEYRNFENFYLNS